MRKLRVMHLQHQSANGKPRSARDMDTESKEYVLRQQMEDHGRHWSHACGMSFEKQMVKVGTISHARRGHGEQNTLNIKQVYISFEEVHMRYSAIFIPAKEGGYTVVFPDIPEIVTEGESIDEAMDMAEEILSDILTDYKNEGRKIPSRSTFDDIVRIAEKKMQERGVDTTRRFHVQLVSVLTETKPVEFA